MVGNLLGYSEGRKTTGLSYKFFIFPPLQATTFNFWPSFLASYMGPQYKIAYFITLRGYFALDGQGYSPFHPSYRGACCEWWCSQVPCL